MTAPCSVISGSAFSYTCNWSVHTGDEGERVEDQHRRLALQVCLREALATFGDELEIGDLRPRGQHCGACVGGAHLRTTRVYLRRPSSLISAR